MPARHLYAIAGDQPDDDPGGADFAMPCDLDAERAVLGAAMLADGPRGAALLAEIRDLISPEDFYRPTHERIWQTVCDQADRHRPTDAVAVADKLGPDLARIGGAAYLHECLNAVPTLENGPYYAHIMREKSYARLMVTTGIRLAQMGRTEMEPDLKAAARTELQALLQRDTRGWTNPVPLRTVRPVPPFPTNALPTWTRDKVLAVAHETQTPPDLAGTLALACLSTAAAGRIRVHVRDRWNEPVNLYTVAALPPGSRKSPVFSAMTAPILAAENALTEQLAEQIVTLRVDRKAAEDYAAKMADTYAKAGPGEREAARFEAHTAALAAEAIKVPADPRLFADDVTPEKLATLLAEQGGAMAVLSAESEIFAVIAGRYSGQPNLNVFLKGHAGDQMRVDRTIRSAETVDHPALTLGICTQPSALADLAAIPGAASRGLLARFLYTIPPVNIGRRNTKPEPVDPTHHDRYDLELTSLTLSMRDLTEPLMLTLSPEATRLFDAIHEDIEASMDDGQPLAHLTEWGGKAVGTMLRIAGLLHLAEHLRDGYERPISIDTLAHAHTLIEYYTAHTLAAFDHMTTDPTTDRARHLLDWIAKTGTTRFTSRDAFSSQPRGRFPKMTDLEPALNLLEQHGHLRRLPAPPTAGRGRPPAPEYDVNPSIDP